MNKTPSVLKFDPLLAQAVGLNEAIVISQVQYWLDRKSKNDKYKVDASGKKWTYNSYPEWQANFPFWSKNTIIRAIESAEDSHILLSKLKGRGRIARSKWYSLDEVIRDAKLLELKTTQNGYSQSGKESETTQNGYFNDSRTTQNGYFAQAITKNTDTKNSFSQKDKVAPYVRKGESMPASVQLDNAPANMSIELSPELMSNWLTHYPSKTKDELAHRYSAAANWLLAHGQYKDELKTISFANVNIEKENINPQGNSKKRTMHITGGAE